MCFGAPMRVIDVNGLAATCRDARGDQPVSLALTGPVEPGAHVLVYLGSAVRVLEADEARQIADAIDAVTAAADGAPFEHLIQDLIDRKPELPAHLRPAETASPRAPGERNHDRSGGDAG